MDAYLYQTTWRTVDQSERPEAFVDYLNRLDHGPLNGDYRRRFLDRLPVCPEDRVLDVGCGIGSDSRVLVKRLSTGCVMGLDFSRHMVRRAREQATKRLGYAVGDMGCLPFLANHFDGVFCNRVLMHCEQPFDDIREMVRVLRPGGWLGLCEPVWSAAQFAPDSEIARGMVEIHTQSFANGDLGRQLEDLVQRAGCGIDQCVTFCDTLHDLHTVWSMANFERTMRRAVELGAFTLQDFSQWKQTLVAADREKAFGVTLSMCLCIARKV